MARRHSQPTMLPYLENGVIKYAPTEGGLSYPRLTGNDDYEPLIANTIYGDKEGYDPDAIQRFTATGRPMPVFKPNVCVNRSLYCAPQLLPVRYTDDSIIPVVVQLLDPSGMP